MKILLEAYVDNNFGDNLFLHIITSRYPKDTFYMIENAMYASSYSNLEKRIPNLIVQKDEGNLLEEVDRMYVVGGDMFHNKGDYSNRIRRAYTVKKRGGNVAFLGLSLFPKYCMRTWFDFMVMFSYADVVIVREQATYRQIKSRLPWLPIVAATDLAFTVDVQEVSKEAVQSGLLGISVRKKEQKEEALYYPQYCQMMSEQIVQYLKEAAHHQVKLLGLSSGRFDDGAVAMDIKRLCPNELRARISCSTFDGDVLSYIKELQKCEKLLCTRFHALVFAILLEKPFVPIVYEEKMTRLLDEIGYIGTRPKYEGAWDTEKVCEELAKKQWNPEKLKVYTEKAEGIFSYLNSAMDKNQKQNDFVYKMYGVKEKLLDAIRVKLNKK